MIQEPTRQHSAVIIQIRDWVFGVVHDAEHHVVEHDVVNPELVDRLDGVVLLYQQLIKQAGTISETLETCLQCDKVGGTLALDQTVQAEQLHIWMKMRKIISNVKFKHVKSTPVNQGLIVSRDTLTITKICYSLCARRHPV